MKCICSGSCWLIGICTMQLITIAVRQTFDVLGLQWSCIIANFCHIAVVILALYGVCRQNRGFVAVYCVWNLIWIGWNTLLICAYIGIIPLVAGFCVGSYQIGKMKQDDNFHFDFVNGTAKKKSTEMIPLQSLE